MCILDQWPMSRYWPFHVNVVPHGDGRTFLHIRHLSELENDAWVKVANAGDSGCFHMVSHLSFQHILEALAHGTIAIVQVLDRPAQKADEAHAQVFLTKRLQL